MAIRANQSAPADAEQQQRAMQDPEIQAIMADPMIRNVLNNFQENPKQAQEDMKDPSVVRTQLPLRPNRPQLRLILSLLQRLVTQLLLVGTGREVEQADRGGCPKDRLSRHATRMLFAVVPRP
jgi:hypothetical protein